MTSGRLRLGPLTLAWSISILLASSSSSEIFRVISFLEDVGRTHGHAMYLVVKYMELTLSLCITRRQRKPWMLVLW